MLTDEAFRAWLAAPLSLADQLAIELAELRRAHERQVHLDARTRSAIDSAIAAVRAAGKSARPPRRRTMVDTDDWPTVTMPGAARQALPSTSSMIRALAS